MVGWVMFGILIFINTIMHVLIQMYFEGHPAFTDTDEEENV
tara:strand:- start:567 stop:689 length:123 start_codon:yes stop_codon:yes gene_type:complete